MNKTYFKILYCLRLIINLCGEIVCFSHEMPSGSRTCEDVLEILRSDFIMSGADEDLVITQLSDDDQLVSGCFTATLVNKKALVIMGSVTIFGLIVMIVNTADKNIPNPYRSLIAIFGAILSSPFLFLLFQLYQYFLSPKFNDTNALESSSDTGA